MIRNLLITFFAIIIIIIINGCAASYVPNVANTPLLSNQGEVQLAVYTGSSGVDPQLAFAITDHLGVMANGSFANRTDDSTDSYHKHQFYEMGIGYYTKIGTIGRFETFGGYGFGKLRALCDNNLWVSEADVYNNRIFFQPTLGITRKIFDGSIATRVVMVNVYQGSFNETNMFVEPVLTLKVGLKFIKIVGQVGFSFPMDTDNLNFTYQPFMMSIGLHANLNQIF